MTDLPPSWEWARLDDVAIWGSGGTPRAGTAEYYNGEIPWAVIGDLNDGVVNFTRSSITPRGLEMSSAKLVPPGTILMAMYGSIGKLGIANRELSTNQAIAWALPYDCLMDGRYLFWYLRSQREMLHDSGKGATQKNISQTVLRSWPIPIPPLMEQRRIVAVLDDHFSRIDACDSVLRAATRKIAQMRDQFIADACTGSLASAVGFSVLPPTYVGVQDGELPSLPEHWKWARLAEIADVVGGITKDAKKQVDAELSEVPYLRVANVQRGRLDLDHITLIRAPIDKVKQLRLQVGDVLLNEGGDRDKLGRGWIWEGQIPDCIHQNHVFRARIRGNQLSPKLLAWHANTFGKEWCERNGKQSVNLASISLSKIRLLPVPIPPPKDQVRLVALIEEHLAELDQLVRALRETVRRSEQLRRSLLMEAFKGRLVQQDPNDAPASVLLEQIKVEYAAQPKPRGAGIRARGRTRTRRACCDHSEP